MKRLLRVLAVWAGVLLWIQCGGGGRAADLILPIVQLILPDEIIPGSKVSGSILLKIQATDNSGKITRVELWISGILKQTWTLPPYEYLWNTREVANNSYAILAKASDPSNNWGQTEITLVVENDWEAPIVTFVDKPAPKTNQQDAHFNFTANEQNVTFYCRLDNSVWDVCPPPKVYSSLSEGQHIFEVYAEDQAGNKGETASHTWAIDLTAPEPPPAPSVSLFQNAIRIRWLASPSGDVTGYYVYRRMEGETTPSRLNAQPFAQRSFEDSEVEPYQAERFYSISAEDDAGNEGARSVETPFVPAEKFPDTTITKKPDDPTKQTTALFEFTSKVPGASFECKLDGGNWEACTSPKNYENLAEGAHQFSVFATDDSGNRDPTPATYDWVIDLTPPDTIIISGPGPLTRETSATFEFTASDTTFECKLDEENWESCTSPKTYPGPLADGPHHFEVRGIDEAGNTDQSPATYDWTIDSTPPQTTISSGPVSPTNSTSAEFQFSANESDVAFQCQLDTAPFEGCASPKTYWGIAEGSHTFRVKGKDLAGNEEDPPAEWTWIVDLTAPDTQIISGPPALTNQRSATFEFSCSEPNCRFFCQLDDQGWIPCFPPVIYDSLSDSEHTFQVYSIDQAGNVDNSPAIYLWRVDAEPPETTITDGPPDFSNSSTAQFNFTSSEPDSTFQCRLDEAEWESCTSPYVTPSLPDGEHTFEVFATDQAGNSDPTPDTATWTVDTVPPDTLITSAPPPLTNSTTAEFSFESDEFPTTFQCKLDDGNWEACESPKSYENLAEGAHQFEVFAIDRAGNSDPSPASYIWTIDITPPAPPQNLTATPQIGAIFLDWDDNTELDLAGYNAYRSLTSGSDYERKNTELILPSEYLDTDVSYPQTYYYVVTAVDQAGNESTYSDEVSASPLPPPSEPRLYASSDNNKLLGWDNPYTINGNVPPDQEVSGVDTLLNSPDGIYYDNASDRLFVANYGGQNVLRFENFSQLSGNVAPDGVLEGLNTGLIGPARVFLDPVNDWLYVTDYDTASIRVFENASTLDGDIAPIRVIAGGNTNLVGPEGIVIDLVRDILYVADSDGNAIRVWGNASTVSGNVAPDRVITGSSTLLATPTDIFLESVADHLYVANLYAPSVSPEITIYHSASTANGDTPPDRCIDISVFAFPLGLYLDVSQDMLFLGSSGDGGIQIFHNATTRSNCAGPEEAPDRQIIGPNTQLANAWDVQI